MHDLSPMLAERAGGTEAEAPKQRPLPSLVIDLHYKRIRAVLWTVTLTVLTLGAFCALWIWLYGGKTALGKMPFINLDSENGLGEWWSVLLLLIAAAFLAVNSLAEPNGRWKRHWLLLAAVFVFLSIDESIGIHESTMALMASYRLTGFFYFSWIIPYGIASIVLGLLFVSFVRVLPHKFRRRFVFAGRSIWWPPWGWRDSGHIARPAEEQRR